MPLLPSHPTEEEQRKIDLVKSLLANAVAAMQIEHDRAMDKAEAELLDNACPHCHTVIGAHPGWCTYSEPSDHPFQP